MFSSIKYKFILIYFVLILIAMAIVGTFIVDRLESIQIKTISESMQKTMDSVATTTSNLYKEDFGNRKSDLNNTLKKWGLSNDKKIYIFSNEKTPRLIASTSQVDLSQKESIYSLNNIDLNLIFKAEAGNIAEKILEFKNENIIEKHIAKPMLKGDGSRLAVIYMTQNLDSVYSIINQSKVIITYATLISLVVTVILGYFISNSITNPIRDVTRKAREMAKGNFNQKVDVKSDDEIGKLGSMFNYLTKELNRTIEEMDLEKSKLNTIFNYMQEGVIAVDRSGILIHANPTAKKILGIKEEELGKKIDLTRIGLSDINYADNKSLRGENILELNYNFYKLKYAPYKSEFNINLGLIIVFQDINREHKLENMRKEFVANVSHELKTPITTIKSYTETLLLEDIPKEEKKKFLNIIDKENNRMSRIVTDLLELSNIDYDKGKFENRYFDTYEFVYEAVESESVLINEKKHKIKLNIPFHINNIYSDRNKALQVLTNIISNAVKYTEENGEITISAKNAGNFVEIEVKDNGIGIPEKDIERIFERFYRVEKGRSRRMGGTGLGLSIAKEFMTKLGGKISIESVLDEGTSVKLFFTLGDRHE